MIPFLLVLLTSVSAPVEDAGLTFDLRHFERFLTWFYIERALFSAGLCILVAVLCLLVAFPFTWFLTGCGPKTRTAWLIYILAQLSLSEVLIAFSWQILLSRRSGIGNILEWAGIVEKSFSMAPSAGAVLAALVYLAIPFAVLLLFPALTRLDRSLIEAARTLGASPVRAFLTIILPVTRKALVSGGITIFVLALGAVIIPQVLGKPGHWTLAVLITDQAVFDFNMPFASALAVVLLLLSGSVIALASGYAGRGRGNRADRGVDMPGGKEMP